VSPRFFECGSRRGSAVAGWCKRVDGPCSFVTNSKFQENLILPGSSDPVSQKHNRFRQNRRAVHLAAQATGFARDHSRSIGRRRRGRLQDVWNGEVTAKVIFCSRLAADPDDEICCGELTKATQRALRQRTAICSLRTSYRVAARLPESDSSIDRFLACECSRMSELRL
jgi:hypothetical protein